MLATGPIQYTRDRRRSKSRLFNFHEHFARLEVVGFRVLAEDDAPRFSSEGQRQRSRQGSSPLEHYHFSSDNAVAAFVAAKQHGPVYPAGSANPATATFD